MASTIKQVFTRAVQHMSTRPVLSALKSSVSSPTRLSRSFSVSAKSLHEASSSSKSTAVVPWKPPPGSAKSSSSGASKWIPSTESSSSTSSSAPPTRSTTKIMLSQVVTQTDLERSALAAKKREVSDQLFCWRMLESRRMLGAPDVSGPGKDTTYRMDDFPTESHRPEGVPYPGEPKSYVDAEGAVHPTGTQDDVTAHVIGRQPEKSQSGYTSTFSRKGTLEEVLNSIPDAIKSWGDNVVEVNTSKFPAVLDNRTLLQILRYEGFADPTNRAIATFKDETGTPAPWTPEKDLMFQSTSAEEAREKLDLLVDAGITPGKAEYTVYEKAQAYAAVAREVLVFGSSQPQAATVHKLPQSAEKA